MRPWIPGSGWVVVKNPSEGPADVFSPYSEECLLMQKEGARLFSMGTLPEFAGTSAPDTFQGGTGGNFAIRNPKDPEKFVVTSSGSHKGRLRNEDFVEVVSVDWAAEKIYVQRSVSNALPSTDTLLVALVFERHPWIGAWIHFHAPVKTPHSIRLAYPSFTAKDREALSALIDSGVRAINMIDHDILKVSDDKPDSAIILGGDARATFAFARKLLVRS